MLSPARSPFGVARKRAPTVTTQPTAPLASHPALEESYLDDSPVIKPKRSFFKRKLSKSSQQKPPAPSPHSPATSSEGFQAHSPARHDAPQLSLPTTDAIPLSDWLLERPRTAPGLAPRLRLQTELPVFPFPSLSPRSTPRNSVDDAAEHTSSAPLNRFQPLAGRSRGASLMQPQTRVMYRSPSHAILRPPPEPAAQEQAFNVRGMHFPVPPMLSSLPGRPSGELTASSSDSSTMSIASSAAYDSSQESSFNMPITPKGSWEEIHKASRKRSGSHAEFGTLGVRAKPSFEMRPALDARVRPSLDARPSMEYRPSMDEMGFVDSRADRTIPVGARSPRRRTPTPHAATVRNHKDLPPLPPPPFPPPAIPLPPTPFQMQQTLQDERLRAETLEDKLRRVMAERDALANRARALEGENKMLRGKEDSFAYISNMLAHSSAESSSADEWEGDLFWRGPSMQPLSISPRALTPDGSSQSHDDLTPPARATPRPEPPPPRSRTFPEHAPARPLPMMASFSQSSVSRPQSPLRANVVRVRHGPSRSISSLPVPQPSSATIEVVRARSPGLHGPRPSTAGGRARRPTLLDPK